MCFKGWIQEESDIDGTMSNTISGKLTISTIFNVSLKINAGMKH